MPPFLPRHARLSFAVIRVLAMLAVAALAGAVPSHAGILFGPEVFVRDTNKPRTETRIVSTSGYVGPFTIRIRIGDHLGQARLSSAMIWVDGRLIVIRRAVSRKVTEHAGPVVLAPKSTLQVSIKGTPGSRLTITIEGTRFVPRLVPVPDSSSAVSLLVSARGGRLETEAAGVRYRLDIPANALHVPDRITITPLTLLTGLPLGGPLLGAVRLEPAGLRFLTPVTLTIHLPTAPAAPMGFGSQDDGTGVHLHPIAAAGQEITMQLAHFTIAGAATAGCDDLAAMTDPTWLTGEDRARHRIALVRSNSKCLNDPDFDLLGSMLDIHLAWYFGDGVEAAVVAAELAPEEAGPCEHRSDGVPARLICAVSLVEAWWASVLDVFLDDETPLLPALPCRHPSGRPCVTLGDVIVAARTSIAFSVRRALVDSNDRCLRGGVGDDQDTRGWLVLAEELYQGLYEDYIDIVELRALKTCGIASLEIAAPLATLNVGQQVQLELIARDLTGALLPSPPVTWLVTERTVATLDERGLLTGVGMGRATVYAVTPEGLQSNELSFTVVVRITVDPALIILRPGQAALAVVRDEMGRPLTDVSWSTSDSLVASVDGGLVHARDAHGWTTIVARWGSVLATALVGVVYPEPGPFGGFWFDPSGTSAGRCISQNGDVVQWFSLYPLLDPSWPVFPGGGVVGDTVTRVDIAESSSGPRGRPTTIRQATFLQRVGAELHAWMTQEYFDNRPGPQPFQVYSSPRLIFRRPEFGGAAWVGSGGPGRPANVIVNEDCTEQTTSIRFPAAHLNVGVRADGSPVNPPVKVASGGGVGFFSISGALVGGIPGLEFLPPNPSDIPGLEIGVQGIIDGDTVTGTFSSTYFVLPWSGIRVAPP